MRIRRFDWDSGNLFKSEVKHGINKQEAESIFYDPSFSFYFNFKHSTETEERFNGYGISDLNRVLFCTFTVRNKRIRIISTRIANRKERNLYEATKI